MLKKNVFFLSKNKIFINKLSFEALFVENGWFFLKYWTFGTILGQLSQKMRFRNITIFFRVHQTTLQTLNKCTKAFQMSCQWTLYALFQSDLDPLKFNYIVAPWVALTMD